MRLFAGAVNTAFLTGQGVLQFFAVSQSSLCLCLVCLAAFHTHVHMSKSVDTSAAAPLDTNFSGKIS